MLADRQYINNLKQNLLVYLQPWGLTPQLLINNSDWFLLMGSPVEHVDAQAQMLSELVTIKKISIDTALKHVFERTYSFERVKRANDCYFGYFYHAEEAARPSETKMAVDQEDLEVAELTSGMRGVTFW